MDWHQHFQQIFFGEWKSAGLPDPLLYTATYIDAREHHHQPVPFIEPDVENGLGISYQQLKSVYGFGKVTGELMCELLSLSKEKTVRVADWCGRFNLGISLFDYICDELHGKDRLLSLNVFQPLLSSSVESDAATGPAEQLLSSLAASVLEEVHLSGNAEMAAAMKSMFEAEHLVADTILSADEDLNFMKKALYLKSAEPFRVMALYTVCSGNIEEPVASTALAFGKALGHCYWLVDDAKDLWDDLFARHWNIFLAEKTTVTATQQNELTALLIKQKLAEELSSSTVAALANALNAFNVDKEVREKAAGFIGASLWQWFCF